MKFRHFGTREVSVDFRSPRILALLLLVINVASSAAQTTILSEGFESWDPRPAEWAVTSVGDGTVGAAALNPLGGAQSLHFNSRDISVQQSAAVTLDLSGHVGATDLTLEF